MGAQWELQKAIYAALTTAVAPTIVYDHVPEGAAFPYVTVGEIDMEPWDTDSSLGDESRVHVHVWSRARGLKEVKELQSTIQSTLHNATLSVAGFVVPLLFLEFADARMDPDGLTRHGVQRFRVLME